MKNSSNTMYRIGKIFSTVELILGAVLFTIGLIVVIVGSVQDPQDVPAINAGGRCIGWGVYLIVASILALVFVNKAQKELADETTRNPSPFIITIVFGAIANNPFYVLAGIFGLIADGQQGQQEEPKAEQPAEEFKEEPVEVKEEEPKAE